MIKRFCTGTFTGEYKKTIGVDFLQKKVFVPNQGETVTMDLWDTAGQESFNELHPSYYFGASAAILVFDASRKVTYQNLKGWYKEMRHHAPDIPCIIIANKIDIDERAT
jgi:Rab-like protein 2